MNTGPRYFKAEFTALFSELGKLRTKCHPDAKTFCLYNPRKIPHPLIPKVKSQIETMLPQGVISPKRAPTEWCNQSYGSSLSIKNCVANFPRIRRRRICCGEKFVLSRVWRRKERLIDRRPYAVNKQLILFQRMTKRWSKFYPKVCVHS